MYPPAVAEQLRARGHDVVSVHDLEYRHLEGAPDEEVFAAALAERALVTENVPDYRRLEADTFARGEAHATLVFTSNRHFSVTGAASRSSQARPGSAPRNGSRSSGETSPETTAS